MLDVALPDGCDDDRYLAALDAALATLWRLHAGESPGLIFCLAGAERGRSARPAEADRRRPGRARPSGLEAARERRIPVALSMAGGYGKVIEDTVAVQLATLRAACATWHRWTATA